jgi:hypothetical protein
MSEQQLTEARAALIRIARALGCDPGRDCVPSLIAAQCELEIAKLKNAADALADLTAVERENAELREALQPVAALFDGNLDQVGGGTQIAPTIKVQWVKDAKAALAALQKGGGE